jgi:hypothetical protein
MSILNKKNFLALALLFTASNGHTCSDDIIAAIEAANTTWKPAEASKNPFRGMAKEDFRRMLGSLDHSESILHPKPILTGSYPDSFDARTKWGRCIHPVRD